MEIKDSLTYLLTYFCVFVLSMPLLCVSVLSMSFFYVFLLLVYSLLPSLTELTSVRNLGFIIDQELNMKDHITKLCQSCYQRRSNIRTGSAAYFWLIGFLVNFLCIVAPPVGTRSRRVRFVFIYRASYVGFTSRQWRIIITCLFSDNT